MDEHTSYEQAYKNGYEAGKRDARKKGRWRTPTRVAFTEECSVCMEYVFLDEYGRRRRYNYCPNCGAKMDGGKEV